MSHRRRTLIKPLNRKLLLPGGVNYERRKEIITDRANYLVKHDASTVPQGYPVENWVKVGFQGCQTHGSEDRAYAIFQALQSTWRQSPHRKELKKLVVQLARHGRVPNVEKIVCFGNGSPGGLQLDDNIVFGGDSDGGDDVNGDAETDKTNNSSAYSDDMANRSCMQYPAALDLASLISKLTHSRKIHVYAQEPFLTLKDINTLTRASVRVVNPFTHEGYTLIDQDTFVFAINLNYGGHIEAMSLECARPALILWSDLDNKEALEHPARAAALDTLGREYNRLEKAEHALSPPEKHYKGDSDIDTADWDDYVFLYPDPPALSPSSLYLPKAKFFRAPRMDREPREDSSDQSYSESSEGVPLWDIKNITAVREMRGRRYQVEFADYVNDWLYPAEYFRQMPWLLRDFHRKNPHLEGPPKQLKYWERQYGKGMLRTPINPRGEKRKLEDDATDTANPRERHSPFESSSELPSDGVVEQVSQGKSTLYPSDSSSLSSRSSSESSSGPSPETSPEEKKDGRRIHEDSGDVVERPPPKRARRDTGGSLERTTPPKRTRRSRHT